ncbi:MAG: undecaprenyl-diphosphate phosphatase [Planctomycetota bacterium]
MITTLILALVQGVAEFLPVSSSGHLVVFGAMLGELSEEPTLEIILHAGTLGSILVVYWRDILKLLSSDRRVIPLLIVGTLPAGVFGIIVKTQFKEWLRSPSLAATMLIVTGLMLILLGRLRSREGKYAEMSFLSAFLIGCTQAFAILPGISRSGSTILGGRLLGLGDKDSVTFSFLLAIPAIGGATVLTIKDLLEGDAGSSTQTSGGLVPTREMLQPAFGSPELVAGAAVAFLVGILAIRWLKRWSDQRRLHWFAYWCLPFGVATLVWFTFRPT